MEYLTLLALLGVCIVAFNEYQRVKDRLSLMDEKLNYLYNQLKTLKAENQQLKTAETANQPEPNQTKKTEVSVATKPVFDQKREEITLPTSRHKPANYSQIPVQQPVEFQVESQAFPFQGNNKSSLFV
jgi:hypothetical protein